jgi:hypothetical protein
MKEMYDCGRDLQRSNWWWDCKKCQLQVMAAVSKIGRERTKMSERNAFGDG